MMLCVCVISEPQKFFWIIRCGRFRSVELLERFPTSNQVLLLSYAVSLCNLGILMSSSSRDLILNTKNSGIW